MSNNSVQKAIIFDFDGTIADSLPLVIGTLGPIQRRDLSRAVDISRLRSMGPVHMLREFGIPLWQGVLLEHKIRANLARQIDQVALVPGMHDTIEHLARYHKLFVLSSNSEATVRLFLRRYGLENSFVDVFGGALAWHKGRMLHRLIHVHNLRAHPIYYVGDSVWDVHAAHNTHIKAVAVTWGFSNVQVLHASHPDVIVFSPDELIRCFSHNGD